MDRQATRDSNTFAPHRRSVLLGGASLASPHAPPCRHPPTRGQGEWPAYGGDNSGAKYSPLDQINRDNVADLKIAWEWHSPDAEIARDHPELMPGDFQATPIMVDGILYTSTAMCQVVAIDPATGKTLWVHDPGSWKRGRFHQQGLPASRRGLLAGRRGSPGPDRYGRQTGLALDALTGVPVKTFGVNGEVDLGSVGLQRDLPDDPVNLFACTSPPTICRDVVIIGQYIHDRGVKALMPPGDVRGFDVRTGALKWVFHTVPMKGEPGYETWLDGSAERNGNANIWAPMSADDDAGSGLPAGELPHEQLLRRGPARRQPVWQCPDRPRRHHRRATLALPVRAS